MKYVSKKYHYMIRAEDIVSRCLEKAKKRFPDQKLTFCGFEKNWEDCLCDRLHPSKNIIDFILFFNIDKATYTVKETIQIPT
jgi:hypothetical protein